MVLGGVGSGKARVGVEAGIAGLRSGQGKSREEMSGDLEGTFRWRCSLKTVFFFCSMCL